MAEDGMKIPIIYIAIIHIIVNNRSNILHQALLQSTP